jgi:hypothetical protein
MASTEDQAVRRFVEAYKKLYQANDPRNVSRKSYRDFRAADVAFLDDGILSGLRTMFTSENWAILDEIVPQNLSRAEFVRAVLRESARRGNATENIEGLLSNLAPFNQQVRATRIPFGIPDTAEREVRMAAANIVAYDAAVDVVTRNSENMIVAPDVARAVGIRNQPGTASAVRINTDAAAFDLGYTVGALPEFRRDGVLPVVVTIDATPEQIQERYCPNVQSIFAPGRALQQRDACAAGFMTARTDARTGFNTDSDPIGITAACPSTRAAAGARR